MEPRIARLEASLAHIERDVGELKLDVREFRADMRDVRERLVRLEEKVTHLPGKGFIVSALLLSFFGATDEWHQQFTPGRSGKDVGDWTADSIGGLAGSLLAGGVGYALTCRKKRSADVVPPASAAPESA